MKSPLCAALIFSCLLGACSFRVAIDTDHDVAPPKDTAIGACRQVLDAQVAAWNHGNIDAFAAGYRKAPDIVFASSSGVDLGFDAMVARYKKNYGTPELMGTLSFSHLSYVELSPTEVMCLGAWKLQRMADEPHGRFALVLRSFPEGWRIVVDYTSVLP